MQNRNGFTLVEMLVATALVVLMMMMFAQIFQVAGGLVSNQKSMANLDQKVRTMTILLRGDMKNRTFRDIIPFQAGQNPVTAGPNYIANRRRGFFSISENDPGTKTDDVLHLTITTETVGTKAGDSPSLPFSARCSLMFNGEEPTDKAEYLFANPDQPEFDDGQPVVNNTGSSKFAEVCWFLRDGNLYRRTLLIRDPYSRADNATQEPQDSSAVDFIDATYAGEEHVNATTNPNGVFWRDFDYSAFADGSNHTKFHTAPESLDNESKSGVPGLANFPLSLGIPFLRYGSSISRALAGPPAQILGPREFLDQDDPSTFIGRFTKEESTHANFAYPGNNTSETDPFNSNGGPALTLTNGRVEEYQFTSDTHQRRGEDLLMTNVHEFDIQVWDDALKDFVDLGHDRRNADNQRGWYHRDFRNNPDFGNRYDTWHLFSDSETGVKMPPTPYRPLGDDPEQQPDPADIENFGLGSDHEVPLRAVRILIRFIDPGSEQMRDLTFTFHLVED